MGHLTVLLLCMALVVSNVAKRGGGSKGGFGLGKTSSSNNKGGTSSSSGKSGSSNTKGSSSGTHSSPGNYPRQPQVPNQNPPPYPGAGGGYPGQGRYPAAGSNPGQGYPNQGSYPGRNPAQGGYPAQGGNPAQGGYPGQGGYPAQGGYPGQGGYPAQGNYPGRSGYPGQGGYPAQGGYPGGAGSYPNRYPGQAGGNPYPGGGSYPGYPVRGGAGSYPNQYGGGAVRPGAGAYPGAAQYPYWNPNNKIMSPGYGGNYGAYGAGRSPFAQSVQGMGMGPSIQSKGFGKQAIMAAGAGAVAGMALGYGLGSFPRPRFNFHNPQEEYYYNNYMYRRYGQTPSDRNVNEDTNSQGHRPGGSGTGSSTSGQQNNNNPHDIFQNPPPQSYDRFMDNCMKRKNLLREKRDVRSRRSPDLSEPQAAPGGEVTVEVNDPVVAQEDASSSNSTFETSTIVTSKPPETPSQPQKQVEEAKDDDDTVSIVEIGYPALIEQMKARRCVELYMVYAEQHAAKQVQSRSEEQTHSGSGDLSGPLGHRVILLSVIFSSLLFGHF